MTYLPINFTSQDAHRAVLEANTRIEQAGRTVHINRIVTRAYL